MSCHFKAIRVVTEKMWTVANTGTSTVNSWNPHVLVMWMLNDRVTVGSSGSFSKS